MLVVYSNSLSHYWTLITIHYPTDSNQKSDINACLALRLYFCALLALKGAHFTDHRAANVFAAYLQGAHSLITPGAASLCMKYIYSIRTYVITWSSGMILNVSSTQIKDCFLQRINLNCRVPFTGHMVNIFKLFASRLSNQWATHLELKCYYPYTPSATPFKTSMVISCHIAYQAYKLLCTAMTFRLIDVNCTPE